MNSKLRIPLCWKDCSECGRRVRSSENGPFIARSIRIGQRERRRRLAHASLFLLIPSVFSLVIIGYLAARKGDFNRHKPVVWLLSDARSARPAVRDAALAELLRRQSAKSLSKSQTAEVVEQALAVQADLSTPWIPVWGDLVENAKAANDIPADVYARFLNQILHFKVNAQPVVTKDVLFPIEIVQVERAGKLKHYFAVPAVFVVDGTALQPRLPDSRVATKNGYTVMVAPPQIPGPHLLQVDLRPYISDGSVPPRRVVVDVPYRLQLEPVVRAIKDESIKEILETTIRVHSTGNIAQAGWIEWTRPPPVPLAFDIYVRYAAGERKMGTYTYLSERVPGRLSMVATTRPAGTMTRGGPVGAGVAVGGGTGAGPGSGRGSPPPPPPTIADMILRPNAALAESTFGFKEFWDGELVIRGAEVPNP